jgi:CRP-like cAMP-binding protein
LNKASVAAVSPNRFVRAVSPANRSRFLADCERVDLSFMQHLAEGSRQTRFVYFPLTSCISQLACTVHGPGAANSVEVGLVGDEGMLGASALLGVDEAPLRAVVQGAGASLRMSREDFMSHAAANPRLDRLVKRYLFVQMVQLAQSTVCTRYHLVEERLARWLMMMQDRTHASRFHMTHEVLASMLGVRRVGVTQAAGNLHARGLISYRRGEIVVLDRAGLADAACSCYDADAQTYSRWMDPPPQRQASASMSRMAHS